MKTYNLPVKCAAILFDIDSTLYTNSEYARSQIDLPIEKLARMRGITFDQMNDEMNQYRDDWVRAHNGQGISHGNIFKAFGVSINESVKWREELFRPEQYLSKDTQLRSTLEQLKPILSMVVLTNNPVSIAKRTLRALGVEDMFHTIIGLDTCGVSKPHKELLMRAASLCGAATETCVAVGDRYEIDIALPLELGMGGILVDGVEDVYKLPEILVK
jgi:phosphoglycolate phosphatase/putative hydrolase of the HAD superfamily